MPAGIPRAKDLKTFDRPVMICGGAYSNLEAFEAMLAEARRRNIAPSHIIHTGDVIAYCADPEATARALKASGIHAIKGNVEEQLANDASDCGCGFADGSSCSLLSRSWYAHAQSHLSTDMQAWIGTLPQALTLTLGARRFRIIHGGVNDISRFVFASTPHTVFDRELDLAGTDGVIAGHCGLPFTRVLGTRLWHNSGALGMPANDGTPRVWLSVLTPDEKGVAIEHIALSYDHKTAAGKMRQSSLPEAYAQALESGLWPSLDILPQAEKAQTGIPLIPARHHWLQGGHPPPAPGPGPAVSSSAPAPQ